MGLKAEVKKTVTTIGIGRGKGLMKGPDIVAEKPPILPREDSKYALEKLASIISTDNCVDLSNHATKAIGETGLTAFVLFLYIFYVAMFLTLLCFQAMLMMKGLMGHCLNHETALDRIRAKANSTKDELNMLKAWRTSMEKKLVRSEQAREELEKQTELLRQVLEDKEKEINDTKNQLRQAKEEAIHEYCDFDALLAELGESFAKGFDDALRQVKNSYLDLDMSHVTIETQAQSIAQLVLSESTEDLFTKDVVDDATVILQGDGDAALGVQEKNIEEGTCHLEDVEDDTLTIQQ